MFHMHAKFGDSRFSCYGDMTAGVEFENGLCDPFRGSLSFKARIRYSLHLCAKFDVSSFSRSRDIIGPQKFKGGYLTLTMPLLRMICHYDCSLNRSTDMVGAH